ncbi:MAG: hypothetical protein JWN75_1249 [Candidatus Saccharibacteria bacterium]|nr:hypothetical protein [Candidatus Saccharibacteria bacterium]
MKGKRPLLNPHVKSHYYSLTGMEVPMTKMLLLFVPLATVYAVSAFGQATPQPKAGQCPGGYRSGAVYCSPEDRTTRICVPKVGQCPSGYVQSGNFCCEGVRS